MGKKIYTVTLILHLSVCHVCAGTWQPKVGTGLPLLSSPLHYLRKVAGSSEPEVHKSARQQAGPSLGIFLSAPPQHHAVTSDLYHMRSGNVNLGLCTCAASTVPTEPSSYAPYTDLKPFTKIF